AGLVTRQLRRQSRHGASVEDADVVDVARLEPLEQFAPGCGRQHRAGDRSAVWPLLALTNLSWDQAYGCLPQPDLLLQPEEAQPCGQPGSKLGNAVVEVREPA